MRSWRCPMARGMGRRRRRLAEARVAAGKVQGRRTTVDAETTARRPATATGRAALRTSLGGARLPRTRCLVVRAGRRAPPPLANGGAFGGKVASLVAAAARTLADEHGRPVRVLLDREDVVRLGPKRPPVAGGADAEGRGVLRVVRTPGIAAAIAAVAPGLDVEEVDVAGPPTSAALRAAGWAEATVLLAGARGTTAPGGRPHHRRGGRGGDRGRRHDPRARRRRRGPRRGRAALLRTGAAHMALSWVSTEGIAVDGAGVVHDLTIRSFGVLRAVDTPPITVEVMTSDRPACRGGDAVFVAVAAAAWLHLGCPVDWPTGARWR